LGVLQQGGFELGVNLVGVEMEVGVTDIEVGMDGRDVGFGV